MKVKRSKESLKDAYNFSDIVGISLKMALESINENGYNENAESTLDMLWHFLPTTLKMKRSAGQKMRYFTAWENCNKHYDPTKAKSAKEKAELGMERTKCKAQVLADFMWEYNIFYRKYRVLDIDPEQQMEIIEE